nr:transposase family protein [Bradyrhizobium sp. CW4]
MLIRRLASGSFRCPSCGTVSRRAHSRYRRRVPDLPLSGRIVQLLVIARHFRCAAVLCGRQIFTEHFAEMSPSGDAFNYPHRARALIERPKADVVETC